MKFHRPFRIGISGSYGGLNLGDEAILQGILGELRRSVPAEITVFTRDPEDTQRRHAVERTVEVRRFSREEILPEIQQLDLFILGGGGILFDAEAEIYLREVLLAHELEVPVMIYAVSAGPLRDPHIRDLVRRALEPAAAVTVRDWSAKRLLEQTGARCDIQVTADPALLIEPEPLPASALEREGIRPGRRVVGMSVREPGPAAPDIDPVAYHALLANAADYIVDRLDADVLLVPMEPRMKDLQHSHSVLAQMGGVRRASVLRGEYTAGQILSLVGHLEFVVAMRLHVLLFSALQRVPFVPLPYASKVAGFVEEFGMRPAPIEGLTAGSLIAHLDRSWDERARLRERLDVEVPRLQAKARENNRIALELLLGAGEADAARERTAGASGAWIS